MIHALHGNVGSPEDWHAVQSHLLRELHTPCLWDARTLPSLMDWGRSFASAAQDGDILLGYSLGGRLALQALLANPGQWRSVVLISVHPGLPSEEERATRREIDAEWSSLAAALPWPDFLARWNAQPVLARGSSKNQAPLEKYRAIIAQAFLTWSLGNQEPLLDQLAEVSTPVLWLAGADDLKFAALAVQGAEHTPKGQLMIIPDAGHRLLQENPQAVAKAVASFLPGGEATASP